MAVIVFGLIALAIVVFYIASFIQLVIFSINLVEFAGVEGFTPDNFWAWVVMIVAIVALFASARWIFSIVRYGLVILGALVGGLFGGLLGGNRHAYEGMEWGAIVVRAMVFLLALVLSFVGTGFLVSFTSANPGLTDYFVEGNWLGYIFVFLTFFMLLFPKKIE